ncbi:FAD/NAD(P)-binding protein [Pseudomonas sp. GD04058]|uniref:FAD/NAD(P)-binding protein n=1 Tax=Pseudomonas sp. GD04058 TaxID=2975429 RepID=UPI002446C926|nr:FAD/NAD(P)-binding protein [Pseudomonas sp. GD04058]MDG9885764.1 FAD/NAD(P)-binding protein [Pseudomonas sp. GD04058]
MNIALIGGGCSAVLICKALAAQADQLAGSEVVIYEQSGRFGPGIPYGQDSTIDDFILNMASFTLGTEPDVPDGFARWLQRQPGQLVEQRAGYVGRRLMGQYLTEELAAASRVLARHGVRVRTQAETVHGIDRIGEVYRVRSDASQAAFGKVILAVGHVPKRDHFAEVPGCFSNPYHDLERLKASIRPGAHVGILGSKLTAIDMALLADRLGAGHISLYSNSGRLPLVRGVVDEQQAEAPPGEPRVSSLAGFLAWFRQARNWAGEYPGLLAPMAPLQRLRAEIASAGQRRDWQIALDATKGMIDGFWTRLDSSEKRRFFRKYQGLWMSYRHPMPLHNARRIETLLAKGRLSIHRGYRSTRIAADGRILVDLGEQTLSPDCAIDATGFSGNLARLASPLIEQLLDAGIVRQHRHGGIAVAPETHEVEGQHGFYAIGPLTQGSLFYVSAIERLVVHAREIVGHLLEAQARQARLVEGGLRAGSQA